MPNFKLLTGSHANPKTRKGLSAGYQNYILHLAPANKSGYEVCRWRTKGCTDLCLNLAGRGGVFKSGEQTNTIQTARIRRTRLFFEHRETFLHILVLDIEHAIRYSTARGFIPVFRLNGTSDILWEYIPVMRQGSTFDNVFRAFSDVQFYDYTKAPYAARNVTIPNYHLTFSFAETIANQRNAEIWRANGFNYSVVFGIGKNGALPKTFNGARVFDADVHDLRFLDPRGVAGLRAKGINKKRQRNKFIN